MALDKAVVRRLRAALLKAQKSGPLAAGQLEVVRRVLADESLRGNPAGGRAAAVAEAAVVLGQMVGPAGRVKPPPASKKQRKAAKKAAKQAGKQSTRRAGESLERRVDRAVTEALARPGVREALTAAKTPGPAPGTGLAPSAESRLADSFDAAATTLGGHRGSPFWNLPGTGAPSAGRGGKAAPAAPGEAELASMSSDELRAFASTEFATYAQARGLASPLWQ